MEEEQKNKIREVVYSFSTIANIDEKSANEFVDRLAKFSVDDAIDKLLLSLTNLVKNGVLTQESVISNANKLTALNPEKYSSAEDLIDRVNWIRSMNLEYIDMPLTENHALVTEIFDNFNSLLQNNFDCYFTGGLMGYIATNRELERYHSDLDLFFNEEQLEGLYNLLSNNPDFKFVSNMQGKDVGNGHEYSIAYKDTPISIGLFLFTRTPSGTQLKSYYYNEEKSLVVDEQSLPKSYADMMFSDNTCYHRGIPYKMQSLESIYNSKKDARPKDKYDASIIKDYVNMEIDRKLDIQKENIAKQTGISAKDSIVARMENIVMQNSEEMSAC